MKRWNYIESLRGLSINGPNGWTIHEEAQNVHQAIYFKDRDYSKIFNEYKEDMRWMGKMGASPIPMVSCGEPAAEWFLTAPSPISSVFRGATFMVYAALTGMPTALKCLVNEQRMANIAKPNLHL